jgi:prolyl-tRNA synthetase
MMDLYSFDTNEDAADLSYRKMIQAYQNIYNRCGLPTIVVDADSGAIGGKDSHEFMVITESGEDRIIYCGSCHYVANEEKAQGIKPEGDREQPLPLEEIATPGKKTIEEVASFLQIPHSRTLKAVFYTADGEVVFVAIRGDLEVNEIKLKNALKCSELRLADDAEVQRTGLVAGSASPLGLSGVKTIADDSVMQGSNFVAGANKPDYHIKNVNYPRDFQVDAVVDIATAQPGQGCSLCKEPLLSTHGIEVGHIFKLGTLFSQKLGAFFLDSDGNQRPIVMGCYGIGVGRLFAAIVEQKNDDKGIIWPSAIAPYQLYLCALGMNDSEVATTAEKLYTELEAEGVEVLFDDRLDSAGVKFNDADLLGIPLRVVVSQRTLQSQSVEIKQRSEKEAQMVPLEQIVSEVKKLLSVGDKPC